MEWYMQLFHPDEKHPRFTMMNTEIDNQNKTLESLLLKSFLVAKGNCSIFICFVIENDQAIILKKSGGVKAKVYVLRIPCE